MSVKSIKKKKARERRSKEKVFKKRIVSRAILKEEREAGRLEKQNRELGVTFMHTINQIERDINIAKRDIEDAKAMKSSEKVIKALQHNFEIIERMKQEYLAEEESRRPLREKLKEINRDINIANNDIKEAKAMNSSEKVIKTLEHNLEMLEGMKQEYLAEEEDKQTLNKELEDVGCNTLKEKVEYLNDQARKLAEGDDQAGNVGGSADVKFNPNPAPPKKRRRYSWERPETAECEVIKAEDREDLKDKKKDEKKD